jgi:hypothetical protein
LHSAKFFMTQSPQEDTARRFPSEFECELPKEAWREFGHSKEVRTPARQPAPPRPSPRIISFWGLVFIVALSAGLGWLAHKLERQPNDAPPLVQPTSATISSASVVHPAPSPSTSAPRAQLVTPLQVRRASLVRLPGQVLGVYQWCKLPEVWGGTSVQVRYMGTVEHFSQIPPNPTPGDTWNIAETGNTWIYCTPLGYAHPIWVDP